MSVAGKLFASFLDWEKCGRGAAFSEDLVSLIPRCPTFSGHATTETVDSGSRPTLFSRWVNRLEKSLRPSLPAEDVSEEEFPSYAPALPLTCEITALIPAEVTISAETMSHFLKDVAQLS